jgi:CBS domain containing-hemolysin-like protein
LVTPGPDVFAEARDHTLRAAIGKALPTSLWVALPLRWFYTLFYPVIWVLNHAASWLLRAVPDVCDSRVTVCTTTERKKRGGFVEQAKPLILSGHETEISEFAGGRARDYSLL